ncbi:class I SAM-dependent methyltransferase [Humisphaera borealis]|uniref:Methyltransferase domain-containing protein n=1 Tax=Humisphaera borealis TaxID=2807512 RepID=A0A7M2WVR8_9BACT|nr:class I SAM-dependent methyltransferase [Humisphaera borealis]QOV88941.1 methyltransferase domain-containing protein [Humisphaera borealis]
MPTTHTCPSCRSADLQPLYALDRVPLQSNLLLETREEALAMPTGDLRLAACRGCGFITNLAFDPASQNLSAKYEASQGFSGTFNAFARSLGNRWVERYDLSGRTIAEIGCGKGEFLATMCRIGPSRGIGFDPTLDPARLPETQGLDIEWVADFFDQRSAVRSLDFICCRHTLEHIPDVRRFVSMVRSVVGDRRHIRIGFEVPDTLRILHEGAFWDLYYEHCSYFTKDTIRDLFVRCGFEVLDVTMEFDGQYIVLEAKPAPIGESSADPRREACSTVDLSFVKAVADFPQVCKKRIETWHEVVDRTRAAGKRLALWGASSKAVGFLSTLGLTHEQVPAVVDINPHKQDTYLPTSGSKIVGPQDLAADPPEVVVLMNPIYRQEITADLRGRGIQAEVLAL